MTWDEEYRAATESAQQRLQTEPHITKAHYDPKLGLIIVQLSSRGFFSFRPEDAQGLGSGSAAQLSDIEISPSRFGLHFPSLDAHFDITALLQGHFGSRKWMAARLAADGGLSRSSTKVTAAQSTGEAGGPLRKTAGRRT